MTIDAIDLTSRLIACPSITPAEAGALDVAEAALREIGFAIHRSRIGEAPDGPVENLVAIRGSGAPHFAFAGHVDVVPAGHGWNGDAFAPDVRDGRLHGRGAVDMKGAIGAFIAAAANVPDHGGTLSVLLTGDEEGPAVFGTRAIIDWMAARDIRPDMILVGEPTSEARLGDVMKIGRRGSVNIWIEVPGIQGHVAYPQLADNPITRVGRILVALEAMPLDEGTDWFQPSNLEATEIAGGNQACNVIPGTARLRLNIRFNDRHRGDDLVERVRAIAQAETPDARVTAIVSGEAFLTEPGPLSDLVVAAVQAETGLPPALTTGGGTSDARFLSRLAPTVEFGLVNATMHKVDEAVAVDDLHALTRIYARIISAALA